MLYPTSTTQNATLGDFVSDDPVEGKNLIAMSLAFYVGMFHVKKKSFKIFKYSQKSSISS